MNIKLTNVAIAAAIFAFSSMASAEQQGAPQTKTKMKTTTTTTAQQPAESGQGKAKTTTTKTKKKIKTAPAETQGRKAKGEEGKPEQPVTEKVEKGIKEEEAATTRMQEQVVGKQQQEENERKAREARERRERQERDRQSARRAGEAVGRATTTAATGIITAGQDVTRALDQPGKYNPIAATWNPLGAVVGGRVSFNVEYAPVTHHVIIVSPHFANPSQEVSLGPDVRRTNRFTGVGGEVGYRYYTGTRGMNGIFIGPSVIGGVYNANLVNGNTAFTNVGVAADIGLQQVFWDHLALGAGVGVEYLHVSKDFGDVATGPSTIASSGVKPRLLAQAGYAF